MGKWSVQYVRKSIQKHRMKWLYVINVGKVTRFFFFYLMYFKRFFDLFYEGGYLPGSD